LSVEFALLGIHVGTHCGACKGSDSGTYHGVLTTLSCVIARDKTGDDTNGGANSGTLGLVVPS